MKKSRGGNGCDVSPARRPYCSVIAMIVQINYPNHAIKTILGLGVLDSTTFDLAAVVTSPWLPDSDHGSARAHVSAPIRARPGDPRRFQLRHA
jgi:hypothetical protein